MRQGDASGLISLHECERRARNLVFGIVGQCANKGASKRCFSRAKITLQQNQVARAHHESQLLREPIKLRLANPFKLKTVRRYWVHIAICPDLAAITTAVSISLLQLAFWRLKGEPVERCVQTGRRSCPVTLQFFEQPAERIPTGRRRIAALQAEPFRDRLRVNERLPGCRPPASIQAALCRRAAQPRS